MTTTPARHTARKVATAAVVLFVVLAILVGACSNGEQPPRAQRAGAFETTTSRPGLLPPLANEPDPAPVLEDRVEPGEGAVDTDVADIVLDELGSEDQASTVPEPERLCLNVVCLDRPADGSPIVVPEDILDHDHPPEIEPNYEPEPLPDDEGQGDGEPVIEELNDPEPPVEDVAQGQPEPVIGDVAPANSEPVIKDALQPELPSTTVALPERVGEAVQLVLNPTDLDCDPDGGCYEPVHLEVGTVLLRRDRPDSPAKVMEIEIPHERHRLAVVWVCRYDPTGEVWLLFRYTADRDTGPDGLFRQGWFRIHRASLGDYHRPC